MKLPAAFTVIVASALAGCTDPGSGAPDDLARDTLHMEIAWEVARGLHSAGDSLGHVTGVALDSSGNVYVSDGMAAKLWVFDANGRLLTSVGRKGQGPGEFEAPTGLAVGPDGILYVRDVYRVSQFDENPETGRLTRFHNSFDGPPRADWTATRTTRFDTTGTMLYPGRLWLEDGTAARFFLRLSPDGELLDSIPVPRYGNAPQLTAFARIGAGGGPTFPGLNHVPFAPIPAWDVTPEGTVISGDARSYRISETNEAGEVVRYFERLVQPTRIDRAERDDSIRALRDRIAAIPVGLDQVEGMPDEVVALDLPLEYPAYQAIYAEANSEVWVRRWTSAGEGKTVLDVFSRQGEYLETVVLPRFIESEPTPVLSRDGVVGVALDPLTGEAQIVRFLPTG